MASRQTNLLSLLPAIIVAGTLLIPRAVVRADDNYDRRSFYSQPMGYSAWKPPPASIEQFVQLLEDGRLNASPQQYAQALREAGWITGDDAATAIAYLRSLRPGTVGETGPVRMGRILRPYRSGPTVLDSNFHQVVRAGEEGYVDDQGRWVVRKLYLNVIYPERRVTALPAHEERAAPPPNPAASPEEEQPLPSAVHFNPAPQFQPPAREDRQPISRSQP